MNNRVSRATEGVSAREEWVLANNVFFSFFLSKPLRQRLKSNGGWMVSRPARLIQYLVLLALNALVRYRAAGCAAGKHKAWLLSYLQLYAIIQNQVQAHHHKVLWPKHANQRELLTSQIVFVDFYQD